MICIWVWCRWWCCLIGSCCWICLMRMMMFIGFICVLRFFSFWCVFFGCSWMWVKLIRCVWISLLICVVWVLIWNCGIFLNIGLIMLMVIWCCWIRISCGVCLIVFGCCCVNGLVWCIVIGCLKGLLIVCVCNVWSWNLYCMFCFDGWCCLLVVWRGYYVSLYCVIGVLNEIILLDIFGYGVGWYCWGVDWREYLFVWVVVVVWLWFDWWFVY